MQIDAIKDVSGDLGQTMAEALETHGVGVAMTGLVRICAQLLTPCVSGADPGALDFFISNVRELSEYYAKQGAN